VAELAKSYSEAYSCGYSSGIAPDSLFRYTSVNRKSINQVATKVEKNMESQLLVPKVWRVWS